MYLFLKRAIIEGGQTYMIIILLLGSLVIAEGLALILIYLTNRPFYRKIAVKAGQVIMLTGSISLIVGLIAAIIGLNQYMYAMGMSESMSLHVIRSGFKLAIIPIKYSLSFLLLSVLIWRTSVFSADWQFFPRHLHKRGGK